MPRRPEGGRWPDPLCSTHSEFRGRPPGICSAAWGREGFGKYSVESRHPYETDPTRSEWTYGAIGMRRLPSQLPGGLEVRRITVSGDERLPTASRPADGQLAATTADAATADTQQRARTDAPGGVCKSLLGVPPADL